MRGGRGFFGRERRKKYLGNYLRRFPFDIVSLNKGVSTIIVVKDSDWKFGSFLFNNVKTKVFVKKTVYYEMIHKGM